ncbi:MAG: dethiobiotin synthase [Thermodesulfobacteriota bacterium]|nr:MAG: dethiobiotin synthase [Thermodesulfobacteriota bacterium]
MKISSVFITGTDTEVGKTVVSAILGLAYKMQGINIGYFKPVQSGAKGYIPPDAKFCQEILDLNISPEKLCAYIFEPPVSPHLAAKWVGIEIDPQYILEYYQKLKNKYDALIVEGAGGLLVPLKNNFFMRDLIIMLKLPLIIVARPGLGTINHTLLTLECARNAGINVLGIIINRTPLKPDPMIEDNIKTIANMGNIKILAVIPEIPLEKKKLMEVAKNIDLGGINEIEQKRN